MDDMTRRRGRITPRGQTPLRHGFTLIEVLVVVAIIALLVAILLPSLSRAKERSRRLQCASNERQINMACIMHAEDNPRKLYISAFSTGDDSLVHVYPKYLKNPKTALCPSTFNIIRENYYVHDSGFGRQVMGDLNYSAANAADNKGGHSYEIWGWFDGKTIYPDGTKINGDAAGPLGQQLGWLPSRPGYANSTGGDVVKKHHNVKRPQNVLLAIDNDQASGPDDPINNFPDKGNNHGAEGLNIGFLDGHSQFILPRQIVSVYLKSYADLPENWSQVGPPGLRRRTDAEGFVVYYMQ